MKNKIQRFAGFIIVGIILIVLATAIIDREDKKLTYSELISKIELSEVTEIEIAANGKSAYIKLKGETLEKEVNIPNNRLFKSRKHQINRKFRKHLNNNIRINFTIWNNNNSIIIFILHNECKLTKWRFKISKLWKK